MRPDQFPNLQTRPTIIKVDAVIVNGAWRFVRTYDNGSSVVSAHSWEHRREALFAGWDSPLVERNRDRARADRADSIELKLIEDWEVENTARRFVKTGQAQEAFTIPDHCYSIPMAHPDTRFVSLELFEHSAKRFLSGAQGYAGYCYTGYCGALRTIEVTMDDIGNADRENPYYRCPETLAAMRLLIDGFAIVGGEVFFGERILILEDENGTQWQGDLSPDHCDGIWAWMNGATIRQGYAFQIALREVADEFACQLNDDSFPGEEAQFRNEQPDALAAIADRESWKE